MQVCWKCLCTKGTENLEWCYNNVSSSAPWRSSIYVQLPWTHEPTLSKTVGFSVKMIQIDVLHAFHLGWGRDLIASALRVLCTRRGFFLRATQELRLRSATLRLRSFVEQNHLTLTISKLTKANISWKADTYPEMRCKGFDTYVILRWLAYEVQCKDCGNNDLATVPCFLCNLCDFRLFFCGDLIWWPYGTRYLAECLLRHCGVRTLGADLWHMEICFCRMLK